MSSISSIQTPAAPAAPVARIGGTDADGDNDGTRAAATPAAPVQPQVIKPTATLGNNVNTFA